MSRARPRFGRDSTAMKSFAARLSDEEIHAVAVYVASGLAGPPASAQTQDAGSIIEKLKPKKPLTRGLTRSFSAPSAADKADKAFLDTLPTRGLRIDQRIEARARESEDEAAHAATRKSAVASSVIGSPSSVCQ